MGIKGIWVTVNSEPKQLAEDLRVNCYTDAFIFASGYDKKFGEMVGVLHSVGVRAHLCIDCFSSCVPTDTDRIKSIIDEVAFASDNFGIDGYNLDFIRYSSWGFFKKHNITSACNYIVENLRKYKLTSSASLKMELYN
ncbi:MAG TPA: hypothetical protein VI790_06245, partial [Candidatus Nanoarchaeia archaeon]|nr:hypothetical protein [Candidatus Nanoarchaeia archaeon]